MSKREGAGKKNNAEKLKAEFAETWKEVRIQKGRQEIRGFLDKYTL